VRYIPIIFFIFLFSFTVISCAKKSDSSSSSSASSSSASSSSEIVSVSDSGGYIQIESTNHSLDEGDVIRFTTTDTLPKGLALATDYYVVGTPSTSTFFVSATESGTPIVYTDGGTGTHSWQIAIALGSTGNYQLATHDFANGVVTDSSGNVYVTGGTKGGLDGNSNKDNADLFVVKYNSSGTKQWTKQYGTDRYDEARGVATDSSGNVYVVGGTKGNLNGISNSGRTDAFVIKFNSSGTKQWTKKLGTWQNDLANGVATDSSGNFYVTGFTYQHLDGNTSAGNADLFVVKYNSSGKKQWTKQLGTSKHDRARGVATDSSGNVYVTGDTYGGLDGNTSAGSNDLFVVKYNSSGTKQWTKQLGTSSTDLANGVVTDSSGNIYVAGGTYGGLDGNTNTGASDLFVVKYNSSGTKQWTKQMGSSSSDYDYGVVTDSSGNVYVSGDTYGGLDNNINAGYNSSRTKQ